MNKPFERLKTGAVGDLTFYEAKPPVVRLSVVRGQVTLKLRTNRRMSATEKGTASDPLKFLFVVLWACRELKQTHVNLSEIKAVWGKLQGIELIKAALQVPLPSQVDAVAEKMRDWAKKINKDSDTFASADVRRRAQRGCNGHEAQGQRATRPFYFGQCTQ